MQNTTTNIPKLLEFATQRIPHLFRHVEQRICSLHQQFWSDSGRSSLLAKMVNVENLQLVVSTKVQLLLPKAQHPQIFDF